MEKKLNPITSDSSIADKIEDEIIRLLKEEIYRPLIDMIGIDDKILKNSMPSNALAEAIRSGRISYSRGKFTGKFNAQSTIELKRIGAEWDKTSKSFKLPASKLPLSIKEAISLSEAKMDEVLKKISKRIEKISPEDISSKLDLNKLFSKQIFQVSKDIDEQLSSISVENKFTEKQLESIAQNYTDNMRLYIKDWTEKEILSLRDAMNITTREGMRYENIVDEISKSYGVSKSKAKFLARQETHLLNVEMQKERYLSAGVEEYEWQCVVGSSNHPVRPMHKALDRTRHKWDSPPIIDDKGNRAHPGQDFNCRCRARPIVRINKE